MNGLESHNQAPDTNANHRIPGTLTVSLLLWLIVAWTASVAYVPPIAKRDDADRDSFSADRASEFHEHLFADGIPHPSGSRQNSIVRDKIAALLKSFGYSVEVQTSKQNIRFSREANEPDQLIVKNLLAQKPGKSDLGKVMLVAHFDSVPYGPGAADDGVAVAANLEIARMAIDVLDNDRDVVFLFTDGEEYGLLGARGFVKEHEWARKIEFVINLEARGTTGPSLMFQTSDDSLTMIRLFSQSVKRPVSSSIFEEVYKRLPRDTDFTVFREQGGMRGFNFAFIGDARKYHTDQDTVENADRRSMQHHGENAWSLLQQISRLPQAERTSESAVYFDVFGRFIVFWPSSYSLIFSIAALATISTTVFFVRGRVSSSQILRTLAQLAIATLALVLCFALLDFSFNLENRFQPPWVDHPVSFAIAFWTAGIAAFLFACHGVSNPDSTFEESTDTTAWLVTWIGWAAAATTVSATVVGASYLFIVPVGCAILTRFTLGRWHRCIVNANLISSLAAAIMVIPIGALFYDALGFSANGVIGFRCWLMCTTLLPMMAKSTKTELAIVSWATLAIGLIATVVAITQNSPG